MTVSRLHRRPMSINFVGTACVTRSTPGVRTDATLTWGEDQDYATLDPRVTQSRHEAQAIMQMFESLLFLDTDGLDEAGWQMGAGGIRQQNGRPPEIRFITLLEPDLEAAVKDVGIKLNVETVTKARQDEMVMHG